jgi:hypothetical protein
MSEKPDLKLVPPPDDLSDLWLDPALGDPLVDSVIHIVPIGKPKDFYRVHPSPDYRRRTEVYTCKSENQIEETNFIVAKPMQGRIEEARPATIVTVVYRDGSPRLWALKYPKSGEKDNDAWVSARLAARGGMTKWLRLVWVRRAYVTREAQPGYAPEPDWSKLPTFDQLIRLAFGENGIIRDENHPAYRDLMGAVSRSGSGDDDDL